MALNAFRLVTTTQVQQGVAQTRPALPDAFANAYVPPIEDAVLAYLNRPWLRDDARVDWFNPSNESYLLLPLTPVESVTEVRYDPAGGYGDIPETFGSTTVLTAGDDYYLKKDAPEFGAGWSKTGILYRRNMTWGFRRQWSSNLLGSAITEARGTVKVTYKGGYTLGQNMPGSVSIAVVKALVILWLTLPYTGPLQSEMLGGYSYSRNANVDLQSGQFSEVRSLLGPYRRLRPNAGSVSG